MNGNQLKILIISPNEFLRDFFTVFLTREGYKVSSSGEVREALKSVEREEFNLIFLESGLPRLNGKTVVRKIKEIKDIPVLLIVAGGIDYRTMMSLQEGAADYIEVPADIEEIRDKIQKILKDKEGKYV